MNKFQDIISREVDFEDAKLMGLDFSEFKLVKKVLNRKPTYVELGIFAALWSEHCSYKTSRIHLKKLPAKGKKVLQGPGENAGIIEVDGDICTCFKIESHNHPSFIEPYQGAATGVGGILRDIFAMGARPEVLLDSLRFGPLENEHNAYLLERVVEGIADYGNCMGIPTAGGEVFFDKSYSKNPLVNVFALGFVRKGEIFRAYAGKAGNLVIYVGSKTGRDGIHGATMASESFGDNTESKKINVQIGDPFKEKLLLEACLELTQGKLIVGIQDMGAAGLTSSVFELASKSNCGIALNLDNVPLREADMNPYEIMLSESQERMLVISRPENVEKIKEVFTKWDLDMALIGTVLEEKVVSIDWKGFKVAEVPVDRLDDLTPLLDRPSARPSYISSSIKDSIDINVVRDFDANEILLRLLSSLNICSKKWIFRQFDHMVGTNTAILPGSDATVIRIKGTKKGVAISTDGNGRYCYADPKMGAMHAVCEAALNVALTGAEPSGVSDCLNFGNPQNKEIMWQFVEVVNGLSKACLELNLPIISGNVSFYNETEGSNIIPTPVAVVVGIIDNIDSCIDSFFKESDSLIVLIGENTGQFKASEMLSLIYNITDVKPPDIDISCCKNIIKSLYDGINSGLIKSAHDISDGGIAIALAEMAIKYNIGFEVAFSEDLNNLFLFTEERPRVIAEVDRRKMKKLENILNKYSVNFRIIGKTNSSGKFLVKNNNKELISQPLSLLSNKFNDTLGQCFQR
jgi:phosphoribosylformylglycinamidine synthase